MKQKMASSKKLIIALSLVGLLILGSVITIVAVLAAQTQTVSSNINVTYVVDGVGAKVSAKYTVVSKDEIVSQASMMDEDETTEHIFNVEDDETTNINPKELNQAAVALKVTQKIVYEYKFTNIAESAFKISLSVIHEKKDNMKVKYAVSKDEFTLADYQTAFENADDIDNFMTQAMVEKDRTMYIYISAEIEVDTKGAEYSGDIQWALLHASEDELATIELDNDRDGNADKTISYIKSKEQENIALPIIYDLPQSTLEDAFVGYYDNLNGAGDLYYDENGISKKSTNGLTVSKLYATYSKVFEVDEVTQTITDLTEYGLNVNTLKVPSGIKTIGENAFEGANASSIVFEDEAEQLAYADAIVLLEIKTNAFKDCRNLSTITIPNSVTSIGASAFSGCAGLKEISLPFVGLTNQDDGVRHNSSYVEEYLFGAIFGSTNFDGAQEVQVQKYEWDFVYCTYYLPSGLKNVFITGGKELSYGAFLGYSMIENLYLPSTLQYFNHNGSFTEYANSNMNIYLTDLTPVFQSSYTAGGLSPFVCKQVYYNNVPISELEELVVPDNVQTIASFSFVDFANKLGGKKIKKLKLTSNLSSVNSSVFSSGLYSNDYVDILELENLIDWFNISGITEIIKVSEEIYANGEKVSNDLVIPEGVTKLEFYAFNGIDFITSIKIPKTVTTIDSFAFYGCENLVSLVIDDENEVYNSGNGSNCVIETATKTLIKGLKNSTIPDGVLKIKENAFSNSGLSGTLSLPSSLVEIGINAFQNCSGLTGELSLPSSLVKIGNGAFQNCSGLTGELSLPSSLVEIGNGAFSGCNSLTSITIPSTVTSIGSGAFANCSSLTEINYNAKKTVYTGGSSGICEGSGVNGNGITLNIGSLVEEISSYCFTSNIYYGGSPNYIKSINIAENSALLKVGSSAFENNSQLTSVNVASIDDFAKIDFENYYANPLYYAQNLYIDGELVTSATISENVNKIGSYAFYNYSKLTEINIPSSVTTIGESALAFTAITEINIPSSVTSIGKDAFLGINTTTYNEYKNAYYLGNDDNPYYYFVNIIDRSATAVDIHENTKIIDVNAFRYNSLITEITIPSSVENIGSYAFQNCTSLQTVTIDADIIIEDYMFDSCSNLVTIYVNGSIDRIGEYAFQYCSQLKEIIGLNGLNNVTSIGEYAFYYCSQLTSVSLPTSLTIIENSTFSGCSSLQSITIPEGVESIESSAFNGCTGLAELSLPSTLINIGSSAFSGCSELLSLTIPENVENINSYAFQNCSKIKTLSLSNKLTMIGDYAFDNCSNLNSISIPKNVSFIGERAFAGCGAVAETISVDAENEYYSSGDEANCIVEMATKKLLVGCKNTIIPSDVEIIDHSAFKGCTGLSEIVCPTTLKSIKYNAFDGCTSLTTITLNSTRFDTFGWYIFRDCTSLSVINWNILEYAHQPSSWDYYFFQGAGSADGIELAIGEDVKVVECGKLSYFENLKTATLPEGSEWVWSSTTDALEGTAITENAEELATKIKSGTGYLVRIDI